MDEKLKAIYDGVVEGDTDRRGCLRDVAGIDRRGKSRFEQQPRRERR